MNMLKKAKAKSPKGDVVFFSPYKINQLQGIESRL
jgi:hypothetical protein